MNIERYSNISAIAEHYDAFLVDLWGVIHDGIETYDGAADCLKAMQQAGKKVIFLSNAPRRSSKAIEKLEELNIPAHLYDRVITSGEITHHYIRSGTHGFGKKYLMIGPERDNGLLDGTDYQRVGNPADADFVVVTGFNNDDSNIDSIVPILENALDHNLPMICANPDLVVVRKNGKRDLCAGKIAEQYEIMGGTLRQFGKPYPEVYNHALTFLTDTYISRIAAIGDSLETDIRGANGKSIDAYLIPGGILGEHLGVEHGQLPDADRLQSLCDSYRVFPKAVLPAFVW